LLKVIHTCQEIILSASSTEGRIDDMLGQKIGSDKDWQ